MALVLIALGSNVGDASAHLSGAARELEVVLENVVASHVYRTAPMYVENQDPFLNAALCGETTEGPLPLLGELKKLERSLGRRSRERNGPREIDIDLIAYGSLSYRFFKDGQARLVIPHPRAAERRFVLQPLADIAPNFVIPGFGKVIELLGTTNDQAADVVRLEDAVLPVRCNG